MSFLTASAATSVSEKAGPVAGLGENGVTVIFRDHHRRGWGLAGSSREMEPSAGVHGRRSSAECGILRHFLPLASFQSHWISPRVCLSF